MRVHALLVMALVSVALVSCRPEDPRPTGFEKSPSGVIPGDYYRLGAEELQQLERRALAGDAQAAVRVSDHYIFAAKDEDRGFRWLEVAARNGDAKSQYNWGFFLHRHRKDEEAVLWFRRAIETSELVKDASARDAAVEALREIEDSKTPASDETRRPAPRGRP